MALFLKGLNSISPMIMVIIRRARENARGIAIPSSIYLFIIYFQRVGVLADSGTING